MKDKVDKEDEIVIVGMSCRLPHANSPDEFWSVLQEGESVITKSTRYDKQYLGGFIENIDSFDASFFHVSPREAKLMDPQLRILLEVVYHAIEDSRLTIKDLQQLNCGVFTTSLPGDYKYLVGKHPQVAFSNFSFSGNAFSSISGRLSYFYNFNGPSICIDTACSSGLVAMHTACLNLKLHQCAAAIVGGVSVFSTDEIFKMTSNSLMGSSEGRCYPFSKNTDGLIPSEACVSFILMLKSKAKQMGLHIYGKVEAIKVNHDGTSNGFMSPCENSQVNLLKNVYSNHIIDPNELAYIETHGTGTKIGDVIEINSLKRSLKHILNKNIFLGASKAILGHSLVCSGLVSTMKALLSFKHNSIPAANHLKNEDLIHLEPFQFNHEIEQITENRSLIGISAFGFTGTNAHLVLKKHLNPSFENNFENKKRPLIFPISAHSKLSLTEKIKDLKKVVCQLDAHQLVSLQQNLFTSLNTFRFRIAILADNIDELIEGMNRCVQKIEHSGDAVLKEAFFVSTSFAVPNDVENLLSKWFYEGCEELFERYKRTYCEKVSIAKYPFKKQVFWIEEKKQKASCNDSVCSTKFVDIDIDFLSTQMEIELKEENVPKSFSKQLRWIRSKSQKHPIILLPPLNSDFKIWAFQINQLTAQGFQVHIPIYPCHGTYSLEQCNINFYNIVDELYNYALYLKKFADVNAVDIVGWSLGGCLAALAAIKYSDIFRSLCLISMAPNFDDTVFDKTIDVQKELNDKLDIFEILYGRKGNINNLIGVGTSMLNLKPFYDFLLTYDIERNIDKIKIPTMIVHGGKDCIIKQKDVNKLKKIPYSSKVVLPNEGHFIPLTAPKQFNRLLLKFIS